MIELSALYEKFSIIPLNGKAPVLKNWTKYCSERIEFEKISGHNGNIGICCGFEGLEIIDIDNHFLDASELYQFISDNHDLSKFRVVKTGGGGYHIYFKSEKPEHNQIFAQRKFIENDETKHQINEKNRTVKLPDGKETVIKKNGENWESVVTIVESRGVGGQCVYYDNFINDVEVPYISIEERETLLSICFALNEVDKESAKNKIKNNELDTPGTAYLNDIASIHETENLLKNHGWNSNDGKHWIRPGKDKGISATFGKVGKNKFYVFSSNAYPFEAKESYTMFGVRAVLLHNNDFSECAKELSKRYKSNVNDGKAKEKPNKNKKWDALTSIIEAWKLKFRYNELTNVMDVAIGNKPYDGIGLLIGDIYREMEIKKKITTSIPKIREMISNRTICKSYNPVKEFFSMIPKWDGKDHFKEICKYIELDPEENATYFENMLKKHICRTINCARIPDYINRIVLTFHGAQEIGKTRFWRWIMGFYPELYTEEPINPNDKDSILSLGRYIMSNLDDLDSLNKRDVGHLKSYISRGTIKKRVPFGKYDEQFNKITSFVASTNKDGILFDDNNTRWVIVKILRFDWENYTKKVNPIQLWAQALAELEKDSMCGELTTEEKNIRELRNNDAFLETNSEREILMKHFERGDEALTATEVKQIIELKMYPQKVSLTILIKELYRIFGNPLHTRLEGKQGKYYYLKNDLVQASGFQSYFESHELIKKDMEFPF